MSVINDVLLDVIGMMNATKPYADIIIGAMPADNGIACAIATGSPDTTFLDKSKSYQLTLVLNGKNSDQKTVSDALNDIHQALTQTESYTDTTTYQITDIDTISTPSYIGREENKQYLYGSSLRVRFFYKRSEIEVGTGNSL